MVSNHEATTTKPTKEQCEAGFNHAVALNLRKLKTNSGLTTREIAKIVGKGKRTVDRWLAGEKMPDMLSLSNLAVLFDTTPAALMRWITTDWATFGGSTLDACRVELARDRLHSPATGILFDYLVIGLWIPNDIATSFQNAMRQNRFGDARFYIEGGVIFIDEKKVGSLHKSSGASWDGKTKFMFHFRGLFFRPRENDGANRTLQDARRFVHQTVLDLVELAKTRAGDQERTGRALSEYDTPEQAHAKTVNRLREMQSYNSHEVNKLVKDFADVLTYHPDVNEQLFGKYGRVHWDQLTEWPVRCTVITRADCCVEINIDPKIDVLDFRHFLLPDGWDWRATQTSCDGETLYASTTKNPLRYRDKYPVLAVYRKQDRPDKLRCEVRIPNITYHRPEKEFGIIAAAEMMAEVFNTFLPWDVDVDLKGNRYGDAKNLGVPLVDLGTIPCVRNTKTDELPARQYTGHNSKRRKQLLRQGITCLKRSLAATIYAEVLNRYEPEGDIESVGLQINDVGVIDIPAEILANLEQGEQEVQPGEESHTPVTVRELAPIDDLGLMELDGLMDQIDVLRGLRFPAAGPWQRAPLKQDDTVIERFVRQLSYVPHRPDSLSGYDEAVIVDTRGRVTADDHDPARLMMFTTGDDPQLLTEWKE